MLLLWMLFSLAVTPSIALEQEIRCGIEEHIHDDSCYEGDFLVCEEPAHSHEGNCYIVLLDENDINGVLSLLDSENEYSLEHVIDDVVDSALLFNGNINSFEQTSLADADHIIFSPNIISELNATITNEDDLPDIILNENIFNSGNKKIGSEEESEPERNSGFQHEIISGGDDLIDVAAVGDSANTGRNKANFYVYLDNKWQCIGNLTFTSERSGSYYYGRISTASVLNLVNGSLGTNLEYDDFRISVATNVNGNYSTSNVGVDADKTTVYRNRNSASTSARYVRLIPANGNANSTALAFSTVIFEYPDGTISKNYVRNNTDITLPNGQYEWTAGGRTYAAGQSVTITGPTTFTGTMIGPISYINVNYDVAFPTVSGVTVSTKPTIAGLSTTTVTDGFTEGASAQIRNVSQQSVQGKVNNNSTGLSRVIQFKGWKVGNSDVILQPNTTLVWEELLQYATGASLKLTAQWDYNPLQTASFFIRFDSVAVDTEGSISGKPATDYTDELFSAYVGGVDTSLGYNTLNSRYNIADTTSDNSFGADSEIRALYGEKTDGVWLTALPEDDYIFASLVEYANTGYLSVDGVAVKAEDLNSREYAIRWYVFKCQSDAWHIDGKLVRKEGLIHVYKTFAGNKELIEEAKKDFYINAVDVPAGTTTVLDLNNYKTYDPATDTYMWEIDQVDYGELWEITEIPHNFTDPDVDFGVFTQYTVMDPLGDQSHSGTDTSLTVSGMTYALDEGVDEVLRAEFTNIYNRTNSIVIKKQDSTTGMSIGGATFRILQNGQSLKFTYHEDTDSYSYDPQNGTETVLSGRSNGYFEIAIDHFSYDKGNIVIREEKAPPGYSLIGDIEIGYTDDEKTIGIISGNSEMIQYYNGVLIVGNSTDVMSVTAQKTWDCPETEWQDVKVQLLANGKLVTSLIAGVAPEVTLNTDNNWQYTWDNLPQYVNGVPIEWSIKETKIGSESPKSDGSFVNWLVSYELPITSTDENGKAHVLLKVNNTTKRVMLRLTKTDLSKQIQLAGAEFRLDVVDVDGNLVENEITKTGTTGAAGTLIFDNMKCGVRYRLLELKPPEGYLPMYEPIYFTIQEDGSVTVEENYYTEAGSTAYNMIVRNAEAVTLPETGGGGTALFSCFGALLILIALALYINLRKRRCRP